MEYSPVDITANKPELYLTIKWNDGVESKYPFKLLRNACPCAQCRGGHENMSSEPEDDVLIIPLLNIGTFKLNNLEIVGSYALQFEWADTHKAGIFNWEYLRKLWDRILEN
jgi:DUF971 family protein